MGAGTVRTTEHDEQRGRRLLVPHSDVWILIALLCVVVVGASCTAVARLRPYDPEKDFAYGQVEHREPGDAMVVTRATLENHGEDRHALVIDETVDDATIVCVVVRPVPSAAVPEKPREICAQLGRIRQVIGENPSGK
jgi:hypothetical protein